MSGREWSGRKRGVSGMGKGDILQVASCECD